MAKIELIFIIYSYLFGRIILSNNVDSNERRERYPFAVLTVPNQETMKPNDPMNVDFHMTRFSFGNPNLVYRGYGYSQILPWGRRMDLFLRNCRIFEPSSCFYSFEPPSSNSFININATTLMVIETNSLLLFLFKLNRQVSVQGDPRHHSHFLRKAMPFFEKRFQTHGHGIYLFSGGGADRTFEPEISTSILKFRCVLRWIVEGNADCESANCHKDPRTVFVPLGLATKQSSGSNGILLREMINRTIAVSNDWFQQRRSRVLVCFGATTVDRLAILEWTMSHCRICDFCQVANSSSSLLASPYPDKTLLNVSLTGTNVVSQKQLWELYTQYKFILSPKGHGLDCHRTFEILLLGGIPVLEYFTGVMAYTRADLAVATVKQYTQMTPSTLDSWLKKFRAYNPDAEMHSRLSAEYWQRVAFGNFK